MLRPESDRRFLADAFGFHLDSSTLSEDPPHTARRVFLLSGTALLAPTTLEAALADVARTLSAGSPAVSASLFTKRYGKALCGAFYALSRMHTALDLSLSNLELIWTDKGTIEIVLLSTAPLSSGNDRMSRNAEFAARLLGRNLAPLFRMVKDVSRLNLPTMWENFVIYLHSYYRDWMEEAETLEERTRLEDDFGWLLSDDACEAAGLPSPNPLRIKGQVIPHPVRAGKDFRIRRSCCLKRLLPGGSNCTTCPFLTLDYRKDLLQKKAK